MKFSPVTNSVTNSATSSGTHTGSLSLGISRCLTAMVLRIPIDGTRLMAILGLMGRADLQIRFASQIRSSISMVIGTVRMVIINSLLDLHEHGGDTVGPTIVSSTTGQGL